MNNERKQIQKFLFPAMMILSLFLGVFTSYYFIFVNGLFIRKVGAQYLCYAFILSGVVGYLITYLYNRIERKIGFFKTATIFNLFFAIGMAAVFYFYMQKTNLKLVIFFAFTFIWLSSNYVNLIFWKIPSTFFDLGEHKQYNGWISTGEVVSSIIAYSSVYIFKIQDTSLLMVSGAGMLGFFVLFMIIRIRMGSTVPVQTRKSDSNGEKIPAATIWKAKYFKYIFGAIFFAIIIQLIVDYAMLEVTAHDFKDQKELSSYLALWYTFTRILEFLLKTLVSRYIIKELGLFVGLISIVSVLGIVVLGGLISIFTSITSSILIFATLNKLFERSIFRSIYVPTVNVLYQAYPADIRSVSQNFADGYGKTLGQITAGICILLMAQIPSFDLKMQIVFIFMFVILALWFLVSKNLISHYKIELNKLIILMKSSEGLIKLKRETKKAVIVEDEKIMANIKFLPMVGINPKELQSISDKQEIVRRLNTFQQTFLQRVGNNNKLDHEEIEVVNHVINIANKNSLNLGSTNFQLNLLQYKDLWEYASDLINKWSFEEVERGLIYIADNYNKMRLKDYRISLMYIYMYQLFYEKLPEGKKAHELRSLCHLDKNIFSSIITDTDFSLNKENLYQPYIHLLQKSISELTYVVACLVDLKDNFPLLNKLLESEKLQCTQDIINVLRTVHDKEIFDRIIPMIFMGNRGEEVIASELLELVLADEEKIWVLPVMREKKYSRLNRKLEVDFPQASLSVDARLLSIIGKNSSKLSEFTRYAALKCWLARNESDTVFSRISAIGFSNEPTLKHLAHEYIKTNRNEIFTEYCKRTHYDYNQNERRQVISSILERIFNVIIEPIPISILELFIRCKTEDPNFLKENDEGFELLKKVYRGRNIDLENTKKVFIKAFETENEEEILATAV